MSCQWSLVGKCSGNDRNVVVPLAILGTGVSRMQVTLVLDQQVRWRERVPQDRLDSSESVFIHGRTFLNGLTVTLA